ncbi:MAG: MFS transporter [Candidatus Omnitrophota bacterium]
MRSGLFVLLCAGGAVLSFNVAAAAALIPSIASEFTLSQFTAGKIIWLYMLPYGISALFYGPLIRSYGPKKIESACLFIFSLANLIAALCQSFDQLCMARLLAGISGASITPLAIIMVSRRAPREERGKYIGLFFSSTFVSSLAGLFLSGILPWRSIFLIPAIAGFALLAPVCLYLPEGSPGRERFRMGYFIVLKYKRVSGICVYIAVISFLYHGVQQWLGVYFSSALHLRQLEISFLMTLTGLSGIPGEALGGRFSDHAGRRSAANSGVLLMTAGLFILALYPGTVLLSVSMLIWGFGWAFNHAGVSTLLADLPPSVLNEAAGLNSSLRFLSGGAGVLAGDLLLRRSFIAGFLFFGTALLIFVSMSYKLLREKKIPAIYT